MSKHHRTAVIEEQQVAVRAPEAQREVPEPDGLWAIGLLRIAMELKRPDAPGLAEIIGGVAERMGIPRDQFELFVAERIGSLQEEAERRGYTR
jgi:hypothetical protein